MRVLISSHKKACLRPRLRLRLRLFFLHYATGYNESGVSGMGTMPHAMDYGWRRRRRRIRHGSTIWHGGGEPHQRDERKGLREVR